jgi:hypothetical protein
MIICPACHNKTRLHLANFRYNLKEDSFVLNRCSQCSYSGSAQVEDIKDFNEKKINIIRWDLKQIDVDYNQFTGKNSYYYYMNMDEKRKIKDGNVDIIATYPRALLALAGRDNNFRFKFADDYVFHMKTPNLSGVSRVWGFPPPTPALKSFFYQFMLKKANEAIAYDYLNHLRVIYPAMSQPENNPLQYINMSIWADEMSATLKKWRLDRNFIKLSPHPLGYQTIGGEGRSFLLSNELREASYDILMTLGIPRELMEGSSAASIASPVMLRIVENMMLTYMEQLTEWLNWVDKQVSNWVGIESVDVSYVPFKFIDDIQRKSLLIQWGQSGDKKKVSDTTIAEHLDVDLENEQDKIVEDEIRQYKQQKEISDKIQEIETSLQAQAEQEAAQGQGGPNYNNPQQTIGQADQIAQQLSQMPYEQRKSQLLALQKEDYVMYSVVIQRLEALNQQMRNSAIQGATGTTKMGSEKRGEYAPGTFDKFITTDDRLERIERILLAATEAKNADS